MLSLVKVVFEPRILDRHVERAGSSAQAAYARCLTCIVTKLLALAELNARAKKIEGAANLPADF